MPFIPLALFSLRYLSTTPQWRVALSPPLPNPKKPGKTNNERGFIGPHGVESSSKATAGGATVAAPQDVTRMVAALMKYGPAQIGIDASCVEGYTGGIITNCTSNNVDHAVAIVGADTDSNGIDYWLVRNSWNTTFGEGGYFRVQRDTQQMGIFGGYFACYEKDCMVDPALRKF